MSCLAERVCQVFYGRNPYTELYFSLLMIDHLKRNKQSYRFIDKLETSYYNKLKINQTLIGLSM